MGHLLVKDFFDRYWSIPRLRRFDRYYGFLHLANDEVFEKLRAVPHQNVLVVGLGDTADTGRFKALRSNIVAADISMGGLAGLSDFARVQMDLHHAGFRDSVFDIVFLRTVMLHCDHRKLVRECGRILKESGFLFWIEPLKQNPFLWCYRCVCSPGRLTMINYMTPEEFEKMRKAFDEVWHQEYLLISVLLLPVFLFFPPLRNFVLFLQRLETLVFNGFPWLRRWCWISYGYAGRKKCS